MYLEHKFIYINRVEIIMDLVKIKLYIIMKHY